MNIKLLKTATNMKATRQLVSLCLGIGMMLSVHPPLIAQDMAKANPHYTLTNTQNEIRELNIGDKVPDVEFKNLLNYSKATARLSDFKAKLIILDFWSSSCLSCIKLFPHMQSLQEEFKGDLQIILVNGKSQMFHDTEPKIKGILERVNKNIGKDISLPVAINCDDLDDYFPWQTIPHEVWIDGNGKVIAITGSVEVTASNIRAILDGKNVPMHTKKDVSFDLQTQTLSELVYSNSEEGIKPLSSFILIKGMIDGLGSRMGLRRPDNSRNDLYTGSYVTNMPLFDIYEIAYKINYPFNQIIIETKDAAKFKRLGYKDTSVYNNVYSYDITVRPSNLEEVHEQIRANLQSTFHTIVKEEKRKLKCLVIRFNSQLINSYSKGGDLSWDSGPNLSEIYVRNYPANIFLKEVNRHSPYPIIDESGITTPINTILSLDLNNVNALINSLKKTGFEVCEEERVMNVLVIADK